MSNRLSIRDGGMKRSGSIKNGYNAVDDDDLEIDAQR